MKHIIAAALLALPVASLAQNELTQNKEAYLDCLLERVTQVAMDGGQFRIVFRACALKHFDNARAMSMDGPFDPFKKPEEDEMDGWEVINRSCDPLYGGGDCSEQ